MPTNSPVITESGRVAIEYRVGWKSDGSWECKHCHTMIGKNLLGDRPYMLAKQHATTCEAYKIK